MQKSSQSYAAVLKNRGFLNLWTNQILVQLAYNALNFTLIIWVFKLTHSTTAVSALLLAVYLPAVVFGLIAGVLVDLSDRKRIIMLVNLLLATAFFSLIFLKTSYAAILIVAFFINTLSQFYIPAESSSIPLLAKKDELLIANSLFSITLFSTFLLGFGLAGPLVDLLGVNASFTLGGASLLIAFILSCLLPSIKTPIDLQGQKIISALKKRQLPTLAAFFFKEINKTLDIVKTHYAILLSIFIMALVQAVVGIMAVLIPSFFEKVIQINATNASYILIIPLGLGMITGGFLIGKKGYLFPKRTIIITAILISGLLFLIAGLAPIFTPAIKYLNITQPLPFIYQPSLSTVLSIGSFIMGMCLVAIMIPSQTIIQENTPPSSRGKVFSILSVTMAAFSLIPVLVAGVLADLVGTQPIFAGLGTLIFLLGSIALKPQFFFSKESLPLRVKQFLGLGHWR